MKHTYFAVAIEENDKYYAYVVKCAEGDNVLCSLNSIKGIVHANVCTTKKRAVELVNAWRTQYKANGSYLFNEPRF